MSPRGAKPIRPSTNLRESISRVYLLIDQSRCRWHYGLGMLEVKEIKMTATTQTLRKIAWEQPTPIHVFELFGIDYCCGGRKPLSEACSVNNLEAEAVLTTLEAAAQSPVENTENWPQESLGARAHIVVTHHAYAKRDCHGWRRLPRGL